MKIRKLNASSEATTRIILASILIIFAVFSRLLPHPPNFAPIAAVALFGGSVLPRKWAVSLPLLSMIVSDLFIGLHPLILFTWGSFMVIALLSNGFIKSIKPLVIGGASIGASVLFYLVSNFGVWLEGRMYSLTFTGLVDCYYHALPFFRYTLLGDIAFTALLFGLYVLAYKTAFPKLTPFKASLS